MSLSPRWGLCSEHEGKILGLDIGSPHAHRSYCGRKREEKAEGKASYVVDIDRSFRFFDRNAATRAARGEICADHECQREIRLDVQGPLQRSPGSTGPVPGTSPGNTHRVGRNDGPASTPLCG